MHRVSKTTTHWIFFKCTTFIVISSLAGFLLHLERTSDGEQHIEVSKMANKQPYALLQKPVPKSNHQHAQSLILKKAMY